MVNESSNSNEFPSTTYVSHASSEDVKTAVEVGVGVQEEGVSLSVTLLYSKVTKQVLCIEAGKEFVDLLLGFLTLPMGCIIKLLAGASLLEDPQQVPSADERPAFGTRSSVSSNSNSFKDERAHQQQQRNKREGVSNTLTSIASLYDSVVKMDETFLNVSKAALVDPRPAAKFGGKLLPVWPLTVVKKERPTDYYCCGIACNFISPKPGTKCPRHKRRMETPCRTVDEEEGEHTQHGERSEEDPEVVGYAKEGQFIVTNTLEIYPSSAIKSLMHLNMLKSERVSDLENMEITVGTEEILQLLKASICPGNVLNRVFGKHCPRLPPSPCKISKDAQ